jgi:endonuclease/exonuclease/phosphatase family metal-dependent hydrolase
VGRDDGRAAGEHAAILADTSRFTVLAEGTFWLSETPDVPGSMHWGNRITRITTWARLVDRATADTLRVYNAHWDHESQASRERSAVLLLARIIGDGSSEDAVLVLGDFNADARNPAVRALLTDPVVRLADAHAAQAPEMGWGGTFHGFRGDASGERIDAILLGPGWTVRGAGVDRRRWGPVWASDHFAVWAWLDRQR